MHHTAVRIPVLHFVAGQLTIRLPVRRSIVGQGGARKADSLLAKNLSSLNTATALTSSSAILKTFHNESPILFMGFKLSFNGGCGNKS